MKLLYVFVQCTWGILQTLLGAVVFLFNISSERFVYHGAIVTKWKLKSSVSLGLFIFITEEPYFCKMLEGTFEKEDLCARLLVHEYGHTIQSLILGPLYLIIMGIPSTVWGFIPALSKMRKRGQLSYFSFFTEGWANKLGEWITDEKSMEQIMIE